MTLIKAEDLLAWVMSGDRALPWAPTNRDDTAGFADALDQTAAEIRKRMEQPATASDAAATCDRHGPEFTGPCCDAAAPTKETYMRKGIDDDYWRKKDAAAPDLQKPAPDLGGNEPPTKTSTDADAPDEIAAWEARAEVALRAMLGFDGASTMEGERLTKEVTTEIVAIARRLEGARDKANERGALLWAKERAEHLVERDKLSAELAALRATNAKVTDARDNLLDEVERLSMALAACGVLAHSRDPDTDCGVVADVDSVAAVQKVVADLAEARALLCCALPPKDRAPATEARIDWVNRKHALLAAEEPTP